MSDFKEREAFALLTGRLLGSGSARQTYACPFDESLVVKVETEGASFQNVMEWETWKTLEGYPKHAQFFAPCVDISPCGGVLLMRRTERPRSFPDWVPDIWTDLKLDNYGMIDGRLVCHDYGINLIIERGLGAKPNLVKANWWDLNDASEIDFY